MRLIREEMKELEDAVNDIDFTEVVDALTDILYVVYGMGARINVNMDEAFKLVHQNNMSKLCKDEQTAQRTVAHYQNSKIYDSPAYRKSPDGKYFVVYNQSCGKVLKSIDWVNVDLSSVC